MRTGLVILLAAWLCPTAYPVSAGESAEPDALAGVRELEQKYQAALEEGRKENAEPDRRQERALKVKFVDGVEELVRTAVKAGRLAEAMQVCLYMDNVHPEVARFKHGFGSVWQRVSDALWAIETLCGQDLFAPPYRLYWSVGGDWTWQESMLVSPARADKRATAWQLPAGGGRAVLQLRGPAASPDVRFVRLKFAFAGDVFSSNLFDIADGMLWQYYDAFNLLKAGEEWNVVVVEIDFTRQKQVEFKGREVWAGRTTTVWINGQEAGRLPFQQVRPDGGERVVESVMPDRIELISWGGVGQRIRRLTIDRVLLAPSH